jgi:hypothetical protein
VSERFGGDGGTVGKEEVEGGEERRGKGRRAEVEKGSKRSVTVMAMFPTVRPVLPSLAMIRTCRGCGAVASA